MGMGSKPRQIVIWSAIGEYCSLSTMIIKRTSCTSFLYIIHGLSWTSTNIDKLLKNLNSIPVNHLGNYPREIKQN